MRVLYDGQIYTDQTTGGINRYFANLICRLPETYQPILTTCQMRSLQFPTHPNLKTFFYQRFGFNPNRVSYWAEKYFFRLVSYWHEFDVVHPTYYWALTRQGIEQFRCPIVLTVHDMIHEIFAEQVDADGQHAASKKQAILAAQKIICVSENTKNDLLEYISIPEENITVTHLASEIDIRSSYGSEPVPNHPYYLSVGGRSSYKNFGRLLKAFSRVVFKQSDIVLCVVGEKFTQAENEQIAELHLGSQIEHYGCVSDDHLAKLYRCSIALVYPSLYEGFGIPPLEAMACGTLAIASNSSSIPEVVGDAGLLFDPKSIDDLTDILLYFLDHPIERDRLILKGFERAKLFSWDKTVSQTLDVYRALMS